MNERDMMHGHDWNGEDLTGWILTEKLDGCRAFWDGKNMWSRGGIKIAIPAEWRRGLPSDMMLDGEIYAGHGGLRACSVAVRHGRFTPEMAFHVFDWVADGMSYMDRLAHLRSVARFPVYVVEPLVALSTAHAARYTDVVCRYGGEGVVARHPDLVTAPGRTRRLLKLKCDMPAKVCSNSSPASASFSKAA